MEPTSLIKIRNDEFGVIFSFLETKEVFAVGQTCKTMHAIIKDCYIYKTFFLAEMARNPCNNTYILKCIDQNKIKNPKIIGLCLIKALQSENTKILPFLIQNASKINC